MTHKENLVPLSPILNQLVDEAVANGMSRRNAIRKITKIVNQQWQADKFQIYGKPSSTNDPND